MEQNLINTIKDIAISQGVKMDTFYVWKSRNKIPHKQQIQIVQKSQELGTPLTFDQLQNPF